MKYSCSFLVIPIPNCLLNVFSSLSCKNLSPEDAVPLLLAVYQVVTQSYAYHDDAKHIPVSRGHRAWDGSHIMMLLSA